MLIVEDGTGIADANSYVSLDDYRSYAEQRAVVLPVDDSATEAQLIQAMDYLEIQPWSGMPTYDGQSLSWPRMEVYIGSNEIAEDVIPGKIKFAQMQLAIQVNAGVDLMPTVTSTGIIKSEKVGPLQTDYDTTLVGTQPYFSSISALLKPYLNPVAGFGQFKAVRG